MIPAPRMSIFGATTLLGVNQNPKSSKDPLLSIRHVPVIDDKPTETFSGGMPKNGAP